MTIKYKVLATLLEGRSDYDDRLWKLLGKSDLDDAEIDCFNYAKLSFILY